MANYYCKYCGHKSNSINNLTASSCPRHPNGTAKGKHMLYEGAEKNQYACKYCGRKSPTIFSLTSSSCPRHPNGTAKGKCEPAL